MPHVFISYSSKDEKIASDLYQALNDSGIKPFLAQIDVPGGIKWKDEILKNLRQSKWLFFLATPNSCVSQPVMHEIGAGLGLKKKIIPLMWGITSKDLPAWVNDMQAINLKDTQKIRGLIQNISREIEEDELITGIIVGSLVLLGVLLMGKK